MNITVLGEGAWGTAVAILLADCGYTVRLWCVHEEVAHDITRTRYNSKYLPGIYLHERIIPHTSIQEALLHVLYVFEAIPVQYLRSVLERARLYFSDDQVWVMLSKGIESDTCLLPSFILDDVFRCTVKKAIIAGPSFAKDLVDKQMTGVVVAASDNRLACGIVNLINAPYVKTYFSDDVIGVQLGGALKNVIALGIGILDGAGYGDNSKALFLTRAFSETVKLGQEWGACVETFYGLSGIGDLFLTSSSKTSKNFRAGYLIGQGKSLTSVTKEMGSLPEGFNTIRSLYCYLVKHEKTFPLLERIYRVVFNIEHISTIFD